MLTFALRKPRITFAIAVVLFLVSLAGLPRLKIVLGPDELVGGDFASATQMRELEQDFGTTPNVLARFFHSGAQVSEPIGAEDLSAIDRFLQDIQLTQSGLRRVLSPFSIRSSHFQDPVLSYPRVVHPDDPRSLEVLSKTVWGGVLTDREVPRRDFLANIQFEPEFAKPESARKLQSAWMSRTDRPAGLEVEWTGDLIYRLHMEEALAKVQVLNLGVLLFLILGFRYLFGTWKSGLLFAGSLVFTTVVMHGAMALAGSPIDTLSSTLFVMVTIASLEDFIFLSYARMRDERGEGNYRVPFRKIVFPGFLTSLTTFIGFLSLAVSDLSVIRRFGMWAAFGSAIEWVAVFLFIPAVMVLFPRLRNWTDPSRAHGRRWLGRWEKATPSRMLTWISLGVFVAAGIGLTRIHVNDDPLAIFPKSTPFRKQLKNLMDSRGWVGEVSVVFPKFLPEEMEKVDAALSKLENVSQVVSPARILREARSSESVKGHVSLEALVDREVAQGAFFARYVNGEGKARLVLYLSSMELLKLNTLLAGVKAACAPVGCFAAGPLVAYSDFCDHVLGTLIKSLAVSLFLVGLVILGLGLSLGFRWREALFPVAISCLFGPAFVILAQAVSGLDLNFFTSVVAGVLVGISGDNAIQYLWAGRKTGLLTGIDRQGGGSVQCAVLMAVACLLNFASPFQPARTLSLLFFVGLLASVFGDLSLLRGLLAAAKPRK